MACGVSRHGWMKQRECRPAERNNQSGNGSSTVQSAGEAGKKKANKTQARRFARSALPAFFPYRFGVWFNKFPLLNRAFWAPCSRFWRFGLLLS